MNVLDRLKIELANKQYFSDEVYEMYLTENELNATSTYSKKTMFKPLLQTVYDILQSLANDIDLFRSVETEFTTTGQAYRYLEQRMSDIEKRIISIPSDTPQQGNITFLFND